MKVEITEGILKAIALAAEACNSVARNLANTPDYKEEHTTVGNIVREAVEDYLQATDILEGWLKRVEEQKKWLKNI